MVSPSFDADDMDSGSSPGNMILSEVAMYVLFGLLGAALCAAATQELVTDDLAVAASSNAAPARARNRISVAVDRDGAASVGGRSIGNVRGDLAAFGAALKAACSPAESGGGERLLAFLVARDLPAEAVFRLKDAGEAAGYRRIVFVRRSQGTPQTQEVTDER